MTEDNQNSSRLFLISCIALTVTAMTFAIRAGILGQLGVQFQLNSEELGWVNSMAFLGFPLAMMFGGGLYNALGAKNLLIIAFVGHLLGLVLTITAGGFWGLFISSLFIGFANGSVEAACNPLISESYPTKKTAMLNRFHVWFPGGIVIGSLISKFMTDAGLGWQMQIGVMLLPTLVYGVMTFSQQFPKFENVKLSTASNFKALFSPLFLFMAFCMTLTATSELATGQWINTILGASGASPMIILAMITGLMAVGRYFAGPIVHRLNPAGVLLCSAILTTLGLYLLSTSTGGLVYVAAIVFALGVTYFWPTMIGFIAENVPQSGALGMSIIGGAGMFAVSMWNPVIGQWIDEAKAKALLKVTEGVNPELVAGQEVLSTMIVFPAILIVAFSLLYVYMKKKKAE
ncbi:MFS transporter [Pseudocolwellia agarivorans]|uniref:MFS transporter n=1 Tax=Pseudocolwellia agarivorans TaxID=1911682 RepID=UPI000986A89C|nr:MFS transporter [Pseudocolwellia agarivorans]